MSRTTQKQASAKPKRKTFLFSALVVILLVALFFLSFWVTGLVLKWNQMPKIPGQSVTETVKPTPKPSYEDLEKLIIEKDKRIEELEAELMKAKSEIPLSVATPAPKETPVPTTAQTAEPTNTPAATPAPAAPSTSSTAATPATVAPQASAPAA